MNLTVKTKADNVIIALIVSIAVSLLLFYMEEGYNNSKWMLSFGGWITFATCVSALTSLQVLVSFVLTSITRTINASSLFFLSGFLLGLAVLFFLFSRF